MLCGECEGRQDASALCSRLAAPTVKGPNVPAGDIDSILCGNGAGETNNDALLFSVKMPGPCATSSRSDAGPFAIVGLSAVET